jgi:hypothetical protein
MSDQPAVLPYPKILGLEEVPELKDRLVYIIKGYPLDGIGILLFREGEKIGIRAGDFDGNLIDPCEDEVAKHCGKLIELVKRAGIPQAQFYFSGDTLVDIRTSLNAMSGPGMVRDLCSKAFETQEIIDVKPLDESLRSELPNMGYVILKHSSFKVITRGKEMLPLYALWGHNEVQTHIIPEKAS